MNAIRFTNKARSRKPGTNRITFEVWNTKTKLRRSSLMQFNRNMRKEFGFEHKNFEIFQEPTFFQKLPSNSKINTNLIEPCITKEFAHIIREIGLKEIEQLKKKKKKTLCIPTQMALQTRSLSTEALDSFWPLQMLPFTNACLVLEIRHLILLVSYMQSCKLLTCTKPTLLWSRQMDWSSFVTQQLPSRQFQKETLSSPIKISSFLRDIEKLNKTCLLQWLPAHVNIEGNKKADKLVKEDRNNNNGKNKYATLLDANAIADFNLRVKLYPIKKSDL